MFRSDKIRLLQLSQKELLQKHAHVHHEFGKQFAELTKVGARKVVEFVFEANSYVLVVLEQELQTSRNEAWNHLLLFEWPYHP